MGSTYTTSLYFSWYLSERFIPNTNLDIRSLKANNVMCEHKEEGNMKGAPVSLDVSL